MNDFDENWLIDKAVECIRFCGCGPDVTDDLTAKDLSDIAAYGDDTWDEMISYGLDVEEGGEGWWIQCSSYPDDGSFMFAPDEYGAIEVARVIVECERAWLKEWAANRATEGGGP